MRKRQMNYRKLHYFSGITISVFIALHLLNHGYSLFGVEAHITLMNALRKIYRNVVGEAILLLAVAIQIGSGIRLIRNQPKRGDTRFDKLQTWSGIYLAFFFLVHISAVLTGRVLLNLDTNYYFGVAGINTFPLNIFFIPYYTLAILSFFGHLAAIHSKKMKRTLLGIDPIQQSTLILGLGILSTILIIYGLTNGFSGVEIPAAYNILIGQ